MASAPDLPESIALTSFAGVKNTVAPERLREGELETAINVDLDDAGQLRRRRGYELRDAANYHSARTIAGRTIAVRNGVLGVVRANFSFDPLSFVGADKLSYTSVGETVYFASRSASGKVIGSSVQSWGQTGGAGEWVSPVMHPTSTLGAISGKVLGQVPLATEIEHYKGRIYLASEKLLWATELYLYDLVDRNRNFLQFEHDITMVCSVDDGLYIGTTAQLLFLRGTLSEGFQRTVIVDSPVVAGSAVQVPAADVHPQSKSGPTPEGMAPVFMTGDGICAGFDGGQVHNLTRGRVVFPSAVSAAALYREDQGANAYVAVANSAGGPSTNARIGDYVDAEIVRASQGG